MTHDQIDAALLAFLADKLRLDSGCLKPDTRVAEDLGVDGADGCELMEAFGTRFNVDMSVFAAARHFGPEAGPNPLLWLYWLLRPSARPRIIPITVADLASAIRRGTW